MLPHLSPACASPVLALRRMAVELLGMGLLHALPGLDQAQELGTAEQLLLMLQVCVCVCVCVRERESVSA